MAKSKQARRLHIATTIFATWICFSQGKRWYAVTATVGVVVLRSLL